MASIPSEYTLTGTRDLVNIQRLPVRAMADTGSYVNQQKITINMPPDYNDFRGSYLSLYARAILNGGTYIRFSKGIQMAFQRVTVYAGSSVLEDITDYNVLAGIFYMASSYQGVVGESWDGSYTDATRASETNAGRLYAVKMRLESLSTLWPCNKLNLPIRLVIQLADPTTYLEYDGSAPTAGVFFSEVYYNYYVLRLPSEADQLLDASIATGKAQIRYRSWDNYQTNVPTASSQMIQLPFKRRCMNSIVAVYRLQSEISDPTVTGKFTDQFSGSSTVQSSYVKINSISYPTDFYNVQFNQGYYLFALPLNSVMNEEFSAKTRQGETFSSQSPVNRVVIPFDLRSDSSYSAQGMFNNGVNTAISGNSQSFNITFAGASGALSIDTFGKYESVVTIRIGGGITLEN